jgi:hypothetical protein
MEKHIRKIEEARAIIQDALAGCDIPQIQAMLRNADMELHWALWNLGQTPELRPDA